MIAPAIILFFASFFPIQTDLFFPDMFFFVPTAMADRDGFKSRTTCFLPLNGDDAPIMTGFKVHSKNNFSSQFLHIGLRYYPS